jgi:hypothetical protein
MRENKKMASFICGYHCTVDSKFNNDTTETRLGTKLTAIILVRGQIEREIVESVESAIKQILR